MSTISNSSTETKIVADLGQNSGYVLDLFKIYKKDPSAVESVWVNYFDTLEGKNGTYTNGAAFKFDPQVLRNQAKVDQLINAYRTRGHFNAKISPLKTPSSRLPKFAELDLNLDDYNIGSGEYYCSGLAGKEKDSLNSIIENLQNTYCDSVGFEFTHIFNSEQRNWLQNKIETEYVDLPSASKAEATRLLRNLVSAEIFESELHRRYVGHKRFSLQGGETLLPMLDCILQVACKYSMKEAVIGMAHRGRLNVLTNIMNKPLKDIFSEFEDQSIYSTLGSGDVKYHLGYSGPFKSEDGKQIKVSLAPNPSHLEFVNPVVVGMVRAKQDQLYSEDRNSALPIQIHGDAAFIGQGVVWETLNMANVESYTAGGSFHIVINNQVGFTTDSSDARSSPYCTDMAKAIGAPIFHVNSEDVEAACWVAKLAMEFRQKFNTDVIIDLYCYRRYGHNEGDDPSYTQPLVYTELKDKPVLSKIYTQELIAKSILTQADSDQLSQEYLQKFDKAHSGRKPVVPAEGCAMHGKLKVKSPQTGVKLEKLKKIAQAFVVFPEEFTIHPKLLGILKKRVDSLEQGEGVEWGFAENLAFGSILQDGINIRFTGQDVCRGTFSHRHLGLNDYKTAKRFNPFKQFDDSAKLYIYNSTLSESSVIGYEFGYSTVAPKTLVLWEAQFGDFANGGQVLIDQFIASSEAKWNQLSGVTLLLPHGAEGQGPEHSSARLERYLQLCAEGNMQVCVPTTAAQYFHLLRRQAHLEIRRPLVVMNPKSLLRSAEACAKSEELEKGSFQNTIVEESANKTKNVVFLSGKIYYDVKHALEKNKIKNVTLVRIEQLYPFPKDEIKKIVTSNKDAEFIWVQEEARNNGAWFFVRQIFLDEFDIKLAYAGRPESSSVAGGSLKRHNWEQEKVVKDMLALI